MLKALRSRKTQKKIWIGLAIIIIPAFTFWGFGGSGREAKDSYTVGKIFGRNVSEKDFRDSLTAVKTLAIMRFGDKFPEIEKYLDLQGQAWERLILLHEAKARRITVKDKEVVDEIQNTPYFRDKNGFNEKAYQEVLRYVLRLQPRIFEEEIRQNLELIKLYEQVTKNVKLNDEEIYRAYLKNNQELSIYYIACLFPDYAKKVKPGEEEINSFFLRNKAMFKEPPVDGEPAHIPELNEIKDKVKEALIAETARQEAKKKIEECAENLKTMQFHQAAASSGLKSVSTEFFKSDGTIKELGPAEIFWDNAKKLEDGKPSPIISNEQGYYIIMLKSVKPVDEKTFLAEKESFSRKALSEAKNKYFIEFVTELKRKAR
ncbi:MAG: SurA N-terminal domain-containing protein [Candidatus Omnitrophica bacterium]|nr:SurA N-terminal domain-containing protein [Candidatus Omnitrophota bacterium]